MAKMKKDATITLRTAKFYKTLLKYEAKQCRISLNTFVLRQLLINGRMPYIIYRDDKQYQEISSLLTDIQIKINHLYQNESNIAWIASLLADLFLHYAKQANGKAARNYFNKINNYYEHIVKLYKSNKYQLILNEINSRQRKLLRLFHKYVITDRAASRNQDTSKHNDLGYEKEVNKY